MKNKAIIIAIVAGAVVILGGGAVYLYNQQTPSQSSINATTNPTTSTSYNPQTQGKVIFGIKDAAASMGAVSSVMITVNEIDVHSQTQGWITVSTTTNQYDLLALKASGATSLLAQANITAGTYDQMRLMVSKVVVTENGVQSEAKLPSGELKLTGTMVVNADKTSTAIFDFITDESLHVTGNGTFIFTPVVKMETQSNTNASVNSNNVVNVSTGHVDANTNEGMDVNGEMKANFVLNANTNLDVVNNVLKVTAQGENDSAMKITSGVAISTAVSGGYIDTAISVVLTTQNGKKEWLVSGLKNLILTNVYVDAETGAVVNSNTQSDNQSNTESNTQSGIKVGL